MSGWDSQPPPFSGPVRAARLTADRHLFNPGGFTADALLLRIDKQQRRFQATEEIACLPSRRVSAFLPDMLKKCSDGRSIVRFQMPGVNCQCWRSSVTGTPSSSRRGAIAGSLTDGSERPPRSIRNEASVFAPALRLSVITRPRCSPVLRAGKNSGYCRSPASLRMIAVQAQPHEAREHKSGKIKRSSA